MRNEDQWMNALWHVASVLGWGTIGIVLLLIVAMFFGSWLKASRQQTEEAEYHDSDASDI
jgi:hypothetical protein